MGIELQEIVSKSKWERSVTDDPLLRSTKQRDKQQMIEQYTFEWSLEWTKRKGKSTLTVPGNLLYRNNQIRNPNWWGSAMDMSFALFEVQNTTGINKRGEIESNSMVSALKGK